jgi:signal transduction histidine kinase
VDNAVSYADQNTTVQIQCRSNRDAITIRVANAVSNLDISNLESMFDRFWQNDQARSSAGKHGGIGLALSRSLADVLGGSLHAAMPSPQHIEFILRLNSFVDQPNDPPKAPA